MTGTQAAGHGGEDGERGHVPSAVRGATTCPRSNRMGSHGGLPLQYKGKENGDMSQAPSAARLRVPVRVHVAAFSRPETRSTTVSSVWTRAYFLSFPAMMVQGAPTVEVRSIISETAAQ